MLGTILWYSPIKSYGFILGEDEERYFLHITELPYNYQVKPNEEVEFEPDMTEKGLRAKKVRFLNDNRSNE